MSWMEHLIYTRVATLRAGHSECKLGSTLSNTIHVSRLPDIPSSDILQVPKEYIRTSNVWHYRRDCQKLSKSWYSFSQVVNIFSIHKMSPLNPLRNKVVKGSYRTEKLLDTHGCVSEWNSYYRKIMSTWQISEKLHVFWFPFTLWVSKIRRNTVCTNTCLLI